MTDHVHKKELARRLAQQMKSDEATVAAWIDGVVETLYERGKRDLTRLGRFFCPS
ncbi:MAG: hypothetical protein J2P36_22120 [Ktedonobacteraceae bacterium]|nr:hypothetical protein [Ktedonobacteraceae bacterium]